MKGKLLRGMGIALIAMPEPITTPIGFGLLAAAWVLSRHEQSQKKAYLRHMVTEYLHTYRPFGYGVGSEVKTSASLPYRNPEPLYHSGLATTFKPSYPAPCHSQSTSEKVVLHSFDLGKVSKRYDKGGARRGFEGYWGRQSKLDIGVVHHNLRVVPSLS